MGHFIHAHDCLAELPDRIAQKEISDLHKVDNKKALAALVTEWLGIIAAIFICQMLWHPAMYILAVIFIGARQHALLVILHDASHFIYLTNRKWNDWIGNIFMGWPNFVNVQGFRHFHSDHHRHLNTEQDANRELWHTHNEMGELEENWVFPKTAFGLLAVICKRVLMGTGLSWVFRGFMAMLLPSARHRIHYPSAQAAAQFAFYLLAGIAFTYFHLWMEFLLYWIVPYCTWHIAVQYVRLICEHSAVKNTIEPYNMTRTTIPSAVERMFILPRNVGYHHEHHWHPGVPFYNLPELHKRLAEKTNFGKYGNVTHSVMESLRECIV